MDQIDELGSTNRYILEDETYAIIGAAMDVYYSLGCGFLEPIYQEALEIELGLRGIPFIPQQELAVKYKNLTLKKYYKVDFVCFDKIIVEIKAVTALTPVDWA